jgi:DNA-binding response OmpR family regulator
MPTVRVLVVEDEVRLAQFIQEGLDAEGFDVELTHDGLDGLWRARERPYDAIVLDILLPGMNGYKVCQTLREEGVWTPILMLTAKSGEYDEAEALDTGADDFLSKPFSFVVLAARLRAVARRGATPRPPELVAGDLTLDPVAERGVGRRLRRRRQRGRGVRALPAAQGRPTVRAAVAPDRAQDQRLPAGPRWLAVGFTPHTRCGCASPSPPCW